ncbi:hypothetical protein CLV84_3324 [Neolewinella xylanilytica]|uniref:Uncharacterized protein n=1 Tax=Neolewinella xylanilytica TaxID=1514080 RepID=A0A2S6I5F4_9BACT|nr:hypothetical protein [Neolewinella xylanilytica]PPK86398.1 hypothetical protein CLV84_3324 [Neolewinella xylanilytica]
MREIRLLLILFIPLLLLPATGEAQRRKKRDEASWPPERGFSRLFLGGALQDVFERHYDFCGFTKSEGTRDYTPPTIEKFLGSRTLRTRVEKANINGGGLLSYVFSKPETTAAFDDIRYSPTNLLYTASEGVELLPQPREGFDAFVVTKNCGGYLKAALDVGLKPPYAAFAAALDTDAKRNSSVLAMAGSFESPLSKILGANDDRTTQLMARLWQFYQEHPEYNGEAFYLKQFDGIVIKHLTDSKEVMAAEQSVGLNVALPFTAKVNSSLSHRREQENTFSATDWETIVYTDFEGPYTRERLFYRLPDPYEIADYFANLSAIAERTVPLREAAAHRHTVEVPGLPASLAGAGWQVQNVGAGVYQEYPSLAVEADNEGLSFSLTGYTASTLFESREIETVPVSYDLVLPAGGSVPELRIPVLQRIGTSAHPLVNLVGTRFELHRRNTGQYAFQWHLTLNVEDKENPLDAQGNFNARNLFVGTRNDTLDATVVHAEYDERRAVLNLTLESERSWPLKMIDDRNMRTFPVNAVLDLPVKDGYIVCRRPLVARLAVPRIRAEVTPAIPAIPLSRGLEQG